MFKFCNFLEYFLLEWILDWTLLCAFVVDPPVLVYVSVDPSTKNYFSKHYQSPQLCKPVFVHQKHVPSSPFRRRCFGKRCFSIMIPSLDHHVEISLILVDSSQIMGNMVHNLFGVDFIRP